MRPRVGYGLPNACQERYGRGDKNCATTTEVSIEGFSEPTTNDGAAQLMYTVNRFLNAFEGVYDAHMERN